MSGSIFDQINLTASGVLLIPHLVFTETNWLVRIEPILNRLQPRACVVDLSFEPLFELEEPPDISINLFDAITQLQCKYGIPCHYLSCVYDIQHEYDLWRQHNAPRETITVAYINCFFRRHSSTLGNYHHTASAEPRRLYCSFNNRFSPNRFKLLQELSEQNLYEDGYTSWWFNHLHWLHIRENYPALNAVSANNLPPSSDPLYGLDTMTEDSEKLQFVGHSGRDSIIYDTYALTELEIVTETYDERLFKHPVRTITEKTVRALMAAQPYISINAAHCNTMLRELGFADYSKCIDLSYDTAANQDTRIKLAVESLNELKRNNFTKIQLREELAHNQHLAHKLSQSDPVQEYIQQLN